MAYEVIQNGEVIGTSDNYAIVVFADAAGNAKIYINED